MAIGKIVRESQASTDKQEIHYLSIGDFLEKNPNCCHLSKPKNPQETVKLSDAELTVLYRRKIAGNSPYYLRNVVFGPCLENMDDTGHSITKGKYDLLISTRYDGIVK